MRRQHFHLIFLFVFVLLIVPIIALPVFAESASATLRPDPLSLGLKPGETGTVTIRASDVQNMYGTEFHLIFDSNIVEVVDADTAKPGVQIAQGDWLKNSFVAVNKVDNAAGKIDYGVTLLNPAPPVSGSGVIATITFKAKNNGTSPLKIDKAILASRDGKEIKSVWQDGAVGVSMLGQAPSVKPEMRNSESADETENSPQEGLPIRLIVLIGVAGVGGLLFLGVATLVLVSVLRRR